MLANGFSRFVRIHRIVPRAALLRRGVNKKNENKNTPVHESII